MAKLRWNNLGMFVNVWDALYKYLQLTSYQLEEDDLLPSSSKECNTDRRAENTLGESLHIIYIFL